MASLSTPVTLSDIAQTQDIAEIVDAEKARIEQEQTGLDAEKYTQDRAVQASQSYGRRMRAYAYMAGVIVGTVVICAILAFARSYLPTTLCDIAFVIVMAGGIIWAYYIYMDIWSRDASDFDQVNPAKLISGDKLIQPSTAAGIASGTLGTGDEVTSPQQACTGSDCCDETRGTSWDTTTLKCVPVPITSSSSFTTMDVAYTGSSLIFPSTGLVRTT
jgi:hypothetical protein